MSALKDAIQVLAEMSKRGGITDEELKLVLKPLILNATSSMLQGDERAGLVSNSADTPSSQSTIRLIERQRKFVKRGSSGWVDKVRAEALDLVALLELGGTARRKQILEHIQRRWGGHFIDEDREKLSVAPEQRWRKKCNWALHDLFKGGLIERPRPRVQSLTETGRREAELRRRNLPA
ncbi:MAG: winged helix-turn-helix domain-containing protein [Chloroflexi bacterium]|nr:winged helix-turn-helix domain-containing protein [Chloroflexota bacterium]